MILNGTNDPYWTQDALNLYWDDLPGPKWVAYVPNAGHRLRQKLPGGKVNNNRANGVLSAFGYCMIHGEKMPDISWKFTDTREGSTVEVKSNPVPKAVRIWTADADTRDFRKSTWTEVPAKWASGKLSATVAMPGSGFRVFLAECDYEVGGIAFSLTTQVRILGKP
jgi:PhoPQ-activated pathogenicity-related protein